MSKVTAPDARLTGTVDVEQMAAYLFGLAGDQYGYDERGSVDAPDDYRREFIGLVYVMLGHEPSDGFEVAL